MDKIETTLRQFDRRFQIWKYDAGHSQLLLRSVKGDKYKTMVDILFKGVDLIHIPTLFDRFRITEIPKAEFQALNISLGSSDDLEDRYFRVEGDGWNGFIVASSFFWIEEDAEYYDQSRLFDLPGDPKRK